MSQGHSFERVGEQTDPTVALQVSTFLNEQIFSPDNRDIPGTAEAILDPTSVCYFLTTDEQVVAAGLVTSEEGGVSLDMIAISPDRRGSGLGKNLLARLEDAVRDLGAVSIQLTPNSDESEEFFRCHGYRPHPDPDKAEDVFVKHLGK